MANKDDENWFADYTFGQMTGKGWGLYGEMGNQLYQQQQEQKRQQQERERQRSLYQQETAPKNQTRPKRIYPTRKEKTWSSLFAIVGFLVGAGAMYAQPEPSMIASLGVGLIAGYLSGRFYKLILASGIILLIWWVISQNA
jgi:hypothetical protein